MSKEMYLQMLMLAHQDVTGCFTMCILPCSARACHDHQLTSHKPGTTCYDNSACLPRSAASVDSTPLLLGNVPTHLSCTPQSQAEWLERQS